MKRIFLIMVAIVVMVSAVWSSAAAQRVFRDVKDLEEIAEKWEDRANKIAEKWEDGVEASNKKRKPAGPSVTSTHWEGRKITGVAASSAFKVTLVRSAATKAVVEIDERLEEYLDVSLDGNGVAHIGLDNVPNRLQYIWNSNPTMKVTIYLPTLDAVRLSGATSLTTTDTFSGTDLDIHLSGASSMRDVTLSSTRMKLQCSGASRMSIKLTSTTDLIVIASGASNTDIAAAGVENSKLDVSGASRVELTGSGTRGDWDLSGASNVRADGFAIKQLKIQASGASNARVNVTDDLFAEASGGSSIRYTGNPDRVREDESSGASIRSF